MLNALVALSLRRRALVLIAAGLLLVVGTRTSLQAPVDVFPEFALPTVEVQTEAPGLSSAEVEKLVTIPIEEALNGVPYVTKLRSKSVLGLSSVVLYLAEGTDLLRARQFVQERMATEASRLPALALAPHILSPLSSTSRALKVGVTSATLDQLELSDLARWTIRPRLLAIPGVANVAVWGQRDRQLQVLVDPERLALHGVSVDEVQRAVADAAAVDAGGFLDSPNQRVAVRHLGAALDAEDFGRVVVGLRDGAPIRLLDVARLAVGHPQPIGDAVIDDGPGLLLIVEKYPWGNTLDITHRVEATLAELRPALPDVKLDPSIFRPAGFIERSLSHLQRTLLLGCLLVAVVLVAFLRDPRTAFISLVSIPLSLLTATILVVQVGGTINTMVLAGLVIACGEVVDDAVIDVENIVRRLRLEALRPTPRSPMRVVLEASLEVRSAVVYASLIVALMLLPVFFLDGVAGAFFRPLALAYGLAVLASLLVALTITPALCLVLLPGRGAEGGAEHAGGLVRLIRRLHAPALERFILRPRLCLAVVAGGLLAAGAVLPLLGESFLPDFQESNLLMHWVEKPGTSIAAGARATTLVSEELRRIPGVVSFGSHIGRAEVADEVVGPNFTEFWIGLDPDVDHRATVARVDEVVRGHPGAVRDVLTYLNERIKEVVSGASASVVVRIFGPDLAALREKAQEVRGALKELPGVVDLKVEAQAIVPQVDVRLRLDVAERYGLTAGQVQRAATTLLRGRKVGELVEGERRCDVVVWSEPRVRSDLTALRRLLIETPAGPTVRLGDVATIDVVPVPNEIKREDAARRIDVTLNARGRDLGSVARDVKAAVAALPLGPGYRAKVLGEYEVREAAWRRLLLLSLLALVGTLALLHADFEDLRAALLVLLTLPFALIGGVAGAVVGGGVLSLGSIVGFVTVVGIAARNGIMLVSHFRHLEREEGQPFGLDLVRRGVAERLAPILMTVLCAGLALLPIVVRGHAPGQEIEHPMSLVILGGLVTSTALNLLILPALYLRFARAATPPGAPAPEGTA